MTTINTEVLSKTASQEGFNLEVKTKNIFEHSGFNVEKNMPIAPDFRLDILAYPKQIHTHKTIFVVECKGGSPQDILLFFGKTDEIISSAPQSHPRTCAQFTKLELLNYQSHKGYYYEIPNPVIESSILICKDPPPNWITFRYSYSGDFRRTQDFKKLPRNDGSNNLYKGTTQIIEAISNLKNKISEISNNLNLNTICIVPMIITNAKIYIKEDQNEFVEELDWVILACSKNLAIPQYIFVVNINTLDKFIPRFTW